MCLKKLKNLLEIKTKANMFRMQAYESIMCEYFCIGFIDFTFADNNFIEYTSLKMNDLSNQTQFRFQKIYQIEDYFIAEIREREEMSKKNDVNTLLPLIILTKF